jgi:hypothetical protein
MTEVALTHAAYTFVPAAGEGKGSFLRSILKNQSLKVGHFR